MTSIFFKHPCLDFRRQDLNQDLKGTPAGRVPVLGEYGGLGYAVDGHRWSQHNEWGYGEKEVNRNPDARLQKDKTVGSLFGIFKTSPEINLGMLLTWLVADLLQRHPNSTTVQTLVI